jgi:hypothetical protein
MCVATSRADSFQERSREVLLKTPACLVSFVLPFSVSSKGKRKRVSCDWLSFETVRVGPPWGAQALTPAIRLRGGDINRRALWILGGRQRTVSTEFMVIFTRRRTFGRGSGGGGGACPPEWLKWWDRMPSWRFVNHLWIKVMESVQTLV